MNESEGYCPKCGLWMEPAQAHVCPEEKIKLKVDLGLQVQRCSECPFAFGLRQGVFFKTYCTLGLHDALSNGTENDWRQFTFEERCAGHPEYEEAKTGQHTHTMCIDMWSYPIVSPAWCLLRRFDVVLSHKEPEDVDSKDPS